MVYVYVYLSTQLAGLGVKCLETTSSTGSSSLSHNHSWQFLLKPLMVSIKSLATVIRLYGEMTLLPDCIKIFTHRLKKYSLHGFFFPT